MKLVAGHGVADPTEQTGTVKVAITMARGHPPLLNPFYLSQVQRPPFPTLLKPEPQPSPLASPSRLADSFSTVD